MQRASPEEESSPTVKPSGSFNTPSPSTKDRPCLTILAASFPGSNFGPIYVLYMYHVHTSSLRTRPVFKVTICDLKELVSATCGKYLRCGSRCFREPVAFCDQFGTIVEGD